MQSAHYIKLHYVTLSYTKLIIVFLSYHWHFYIIFTDLTLHDMNFNNIAWRYITSHDLVTLKTLSASTRPSVSSLSVKMNTVRTPPAWKIYYTLLHDKHYKTVL